MERLEAARIRGKEICFLEYYLYPFLDKQYPELDASKIRRIAMSIATMANCSAKAVEEMIQLRNISYKGKEDIAWKTEHNIYPHRTTWHEKVYCMDKAKCPKSNHRRRIFWSTLTHLDKEREFLAEEPKYRGESYYWGPILHEEHWTAIEKIMYLVDNLLTSFPSTNWWTYEENLEAIIGQETN